MSALYQAHGMCCAYITISKSVYVQQLPNDTRFSVCFTSFSRPRPRPS